MILIELVCLGCGLKAVSDDITRLDSACILNFYMTIQSIKNWPDPELSFKIICWANK